MRYHNFTTINEGKLIRGTRLPNGVEIGSSSINFFEISASYIIRVYYSHIRASNLSESTCLYVERKMAACSCLTEELVRSSSNLLLHFLLANSTRHEVQSVVRISAKNVFCSCFGQNWGLTGFIIMCMNAQMCTNVKDGQSRLLLSWWLKHKRKVSANCGATCSVRVTMFLLKTFASDWCI